jgi:hypothetical protein
MNEIKILNRLNVLIALVVLNIGAMAYHIYAERTSPTAPSQVQSSLGEQVPKSDAMAVAERIVKRYNANDLDGLYAEFSDVARMQFSKEKLHESMGKLHSVVGIVESYAYSHSVVAGNQDGKQFKTIFYKVRLSGRSIPTGEMKITVANEGGSLGVYGFFLNAMEQ